MEEAVKVVRLARYALYRGRTEEYAGRDGRAWRGVFQQLIGIVRGYLAGEISPDSLATLWRILYEAVKKYDKLRIWIDNPSISAKIKLSPPTISARRDAGGKGRKGGKGNWVTIHGTHVLIGEGGKIEKGPPNLQGQSVEGGAARSGSSGTGGGSAEPKRPENEQEVLKQFKRYEPGTKTEAEKLAQVNPKYDPNDPTWSENCQRCVVAYELIQRGYDVTAKPFDPSDSIGVNGLASWKFDNPDPYLDSNVECVWLKESFHNTAKLCFDSWGDDARAVIRIEWDKKFVPQGERGHFISAKRVDSKILYVDPQNREIRNMDITLKACTNVNGRIWIMRVDNREFSDLVVDAVQNVGGD